MAENDYPDSYDAAAQGPDGPSVGRRMPHEALAKQLGISEKTVRRKRLRGMSDEQIAAESGIKSLKNDPLKHKRDAPLLNGLAPGEAPALSHGEELKALNLRRERAAAELEELKLERERGRLIAVQQAELDFANAFREIKDGVLGMPDRLCARLGTISDPAEIRRVMLEDAKQTLSVGEKTLQQYQAAIEAADGNAPGDSSAAGVAPSGMG